MNPANKPHSPLEVLKAALAREQAAFAFYGEMQRIVVDPEVSALIAQLKDEEQKHVDRIAALIRRRTQA